MDEPPTELGPGARVGPYEIIRELGRGGMGIVYQARHLHLDREAALKRPILRLARDPEQRVRFLREARAASQVSHAHIVPVYEVLEADGVPWIAMAFVAGRSLRREIDALGPLPLPELLRHGEDLAGALEAAHARKILHRDVNPKNVLLTEDGRALLSDFGLARFLAREADQESPTQTRDTPFTGTGRVVGTPGYMSPEQALGRPLDERSDLFSLGIVLYEMAAGQPAFASSPDGGVIDAILHRDPPTLVRPDDGPLPELERIIRKALAKRPDERYQSAREMQADVRALRRRVEFERYGREHQETPPTPVPVPIAAATPRSSLGRLATLGIGLLAIAGAFYYALRPPPPTSPVRVLVADISNTTGEPLLDGTLRTAISAALAQSRHVRVFDRGRMVETLRRMRRDPAALVDEGLGREICLREGLDVLLTGQIQRSGNTLELGAQGLRPQSGEVIFAEQERFKDRGQLFDRVDALARRVRGRLGESEAVVQAASRPLSQVTTASLEALERYSRGRDLGFLDKLPAAKALLEDAVRIDPGFALAHLELGMALDIQGESGDEHYARAYALASETTDRERYFITGVYEASLGRYEDAVRSLQVLVSLYPDDLRAHHQLALALESAGQADRAIVELQRIVALDRGDAHYCGNLLLLLAVAGREEEASREYEAARGRGLTAPYLEWGFGLARLGTGHPDEALVSFERMAAADPPLSVYGRRLLAQTALYRGQWASAERQLQTLIDAGPSPGDRLRLRLLLAQLHQAQKRQDQAVSETERALGEAPPAIVQASRPASGGDDLGPRPRSHPRAACAGPARGRLTGARFQVRSRLHPQPQG